jgi:hypothetical protein
MKAERVSMLKETCKHCGRDLQFDQPYPIHAGFSSQGFLYNDDGNITLVWDSYDPDYKSIVGDAHPWKLDPEQREKFENSLWPAPSGGCWRFRNPIRCLHCHEPFSGPITETIYYYRYKDCIETELGDSALIKLKQIIKST